VSGKLVDLSVGSVETGYVDERRKMGVGDWINVAFSLSIGILLGAAIFGLVQLVADGFWVTALVAILISAGLFLLMEVSDKILDRLFTIGVKPASVKYPQGRKPLLRSLSLPGGFVLGLLMAMLGLDAWLL
jgi:hypothetical protein